MSPTDDTAKCATHVCDGIRLQKPTYHSTTRDVPLPMFGSAVCEGIWLAKNDSARTSAALQRASRRSRTGINCHAPGDSSCDAIAHDMLAKETPAAAMQGWSPRTPSRRKASRASIGLWAALHASIDGGDCSHRRHDRTNQLCQQRQRQRQRQRRRRRQRRREGRTLFASSASTSERQDAPPQRHVLTRSSPLTTAVDTRIHTSVGDGARRQR